MQSDLHEFRNRWIAREDPPDTEISIQAFEKVTGAIQQFLDVGKSLSVRFALKKCFELSQMTHVEISRQADEDLRRPPCWCWLEKRMQIQKRTMREQALCC